MKTFRLFCIAVISAIIIQLVTPHVALADDTTPPPPSDGEVQPTEPSQPAEDQPTDVKSAEVIPAESEQPAEVPPADVIPAETEQSAEDQPAEAQSAEVTPAETDQSAEVTPVDAQPEDVTLSEVEQSAEPIATEAEQPVDAIVTEETTAESILDVLPENTDLVVLDANNQPLPLATESAASAIANSDPWWCPGSKSPSTGGCASYATFTDLINGLKTLNHLTNGTVYVQAGKYAGPETSITLDGNSLSKVGNLTLIGGWDLAAATPSQIGTTIFGAPILIINWTHDVSVQDIQINGAKWNGLTIDTTGKASLEDVIANHNVHDGIRVNAGDSITLNDVRASYNGDDGIDISSDADNGTITLNQVQTKYNKDEGISIYSKSAIRTYSNNSVTLKDVLSAYNGDDGINITANGNVTLENVYANHNAGDGLVVTTFKRLYDCSFSGVFYPDTIFHAAGWDYTVTPGLHINRRCFIHPYNIGIKNSGFDNNAGNGMTITTGESVTLWSVSANGNGKDGAYVYHFYNKIPAFPSYYQNLTYSELLAYIRNDMDPTWLLYYQSLNPPEPYVYNLFVEDQIDEIWTIIYDRTSIGNGGVDFDWQEEPNPYFEPGPYGMLVFARCEGGGGSISCVSPPASIPMLDGESVNLGDNGPGNDDAYTGGGGGDTGSSSEGGGGSDERGSSDEGGNTPLCAQNSINILQLPSGNSLTVYCPISGTLSVKEQGRKGLPAPLPNGLTFVSGLNVTLSQDGAPTQVITDSGHLKPSFVVPAGQTGTPVILYWDAVANSWIELPAFGVEGSVTLSNGGTVSEGVQLLSNTGLVEVGVNFPGIFVLAFK